MRVQGYEGEDDEQLRDVLIAGQVVQNEICRLKKSNSPDLDEIFPGDVNQYNDVLCEKNRYI